MSLSGLPAFSPAPADDDAAERRLRATLERVIADRDARATEASFASLVSAVSRLAAHCGPDDPAPDDAEGWRELAERQREELARERRYAAGLRDEARALASVLVGLQAREDRHCLRCGLSLLWHTGHARACQYAPTETWTPSLPGGDTCKACHKVYERERLKAPADRADMACAAHRPAATVAADTTRGIVLRED